MTEHEPASSLPVWLALLLFLTPITAQRPREKAPTGVVTSSVSQWGFAGWTGQRLTVYAPGTAVLYHFMGQFSEGKEAGRTLVTPDEMKRLATAIRDAGYAGSEVRFPDDRVVNRGRADLTFCPVDRSKKVISLDATSSARDLERWTRLVTELAPVRKRIQDTKGS